MINLTQEEALIAATAMQAGMRERTMPGEKEVLIKLLWCSIDAPEDGEDLGPLHNPLFSCDIHQDCERGRNHPGYCEMEESCRSHGPLKVGGLPCERSAGHAGAHAHGDCRW